MERPIPALKLCVLSDNFVPEQRLGQLSESLIRVQACSIFHRGQTAGAQFSRNFPGFYPLLWHSHRGVLLNQ